MQQVSRLVQHSKVIHKQEVKLGDQLFNKQEPKQNAQFFNKNIKIFEHFFKEQLTIAEQKEIAQKLQKKKSEARLNLFEKIVSPSVQLQRNVKQGKIWEHFVKQQLLSSTKEKEEIMDQYNQILQKYKDTGEKFVDTEFPADDSSIGQSLVALVSEWKRPDDETSQVFIDGYSPMDIKQGGIGDCYLMSALSVIGDKFIEKIIVTNQNTKCGAYVCKFYILEKQIEVIIDDQFPVGLNDQWAFASSEDKHEIWPQIGRIFHLFLIWKLVEKAYAKLNGSYENIVGGKISFALSDLTGGLPYELKLATYLKKQDELWSEILEYYKEGSLLGAGTPEHERGDSQVSSTGIVQGHAYAILDLKQFEDIKLIQLRNPHGSRGIEWKGQWSDNSDNWINSDIGLVLSPVFEQDGVFWMSLEDFLVEFKLLYACRMFPEEYWVDRHFLKGKWENESAQGLPSKKNQCDLSKNPQFGIQVSEAQTKVFITLTVEESIDMLRGKFPIYFMIQTNEGHKITKTIKKQLVGHSGQPVSLKSISQEISLEAGSYPYIFSLMVSSLYPGEEGTGHFNLSIIANKVIYIVDLSD